FEEYAMYKIIDKNKFYINENFYNDKVYIKESFSYLLKESELDDVSTLIQDIEDDRKSIPVLIKQYLKLGGKILAFNLDEEFSDVVDGLILIDLRKTDKRTRRRYMGDEADDIFCKYHNLD
ncbi:MAG: hypothetical protein J6V70_06750, partial [Kiritimatiellae bacterium]|nr:hypothetical protein [Kiritimatiellia bacterium]